MEYTVSFDFNTVKQAGKGIKVRGMNGEIDIEAADNISVEKMKQDQDLIIMIGQHLHQKTKKHILSVDITDIKLKQNVNK